MNIMNFCSYWEASCTSSTWIRLEIHIFSHWYLLSLLTMHLYFCNYSEATTTWIMSLIYFFKTNSVVFSQLLVNLLPFFIQNKINHSSFLYSIVQLRYNNNTKSEKKYFFSFHFSSNVLLLFCCFHFSLFLVQNYDRDKLWLRKLEINYEYYIGIYILILPLSSGAQLHWKKLKIDKFLEK